jgi:hypothetical protein
MFKKWGWQRDPNEVRFLCFIQRCKTLMPTDCGMLCLYFVTLTETTKKTIPNSMLKNIMNKSMWDS